MKQLRSIMTYVLLALSLAVYSQDKKENENHTAALLTKCQLVIDKNNQKAALQGKIAELKKQIEISMRQWETACNEALNAEDITVAQIRHLLAQTDSIHEVELHKRLQERLKELCANNQNPVANGGEKHKSPVNDWKHENDFKAYYNLGNVYLNEEKPYLAIEQYKKVLKINPEYPYAYYNMGCAYIKAGELRKAKNAFISAIELKNTEADFHYNLAYVYKKLNDEKRAKLYLEYYNKIIDSHMQ